MQLIAVIMGAESRDDRNSDARALLDYGFANYALYEKPLDDLESVRVKGGTSDSVSVYRAPFNTVVKKSDLKKIEECYDIPESISAPTKKGEVVGKVRFLIGDVEIGRCDVCASDDVERIGFLGLFSKIIKNVLR
jgi:D-alanyl-D-alanine carboxypeptidase (penicillin-binding protein 5/6)